MQKEFNKSSPIIDVCVIGSGAGGAPIAYELAMQGYKVVVLEKGPFLNEKDFFKDEISVSRRHYFTPNLKDEQHVISTYDGDKIEKTTSNESNWNFWNGSLVGGSSNLMSGFFHRMKPNDFKLKSVFGEIEGANSVDWPISYEDLEPYYDKVEKVIGVSGKIVPHSFLEQRSSKDFPFESTWEHPVSKWFDSACDKLDFASIPTPRAVLPYDALQRSGCSYSNFCGSYGCATGAKSHARSALIDKAIKKDCTVLADSFVYKLEHNEQNEIVKAYYYDKDKNSQVIEAKIFVVAGQAFESSRLLLNSKSKNFPNGLGNNFNQVGKNIIFSAGGSGEGTFEFDHLNDTQQQELMIRGAFINRSLQDWYEYKDSIFSDTLTKGGTIDFLFEHANPIAMALSQVYDGFNDLVWGEELQTKLRDKFTKSRVLTFEVFNDWLPTDKCFVSVSDDVRDKWGIPVGDIHLYGHPHDIKVGEYLAKKSVKVLEAMGATNISYGISDAPPPNLVAGGCRFGNDEKSSVLDVNCKMHALKNLYVSDASFMPTGGSVPYTWTIYANSFRIADKIIEKLKSEKLS
jgi:choline dehydrogenase-like flavoprotein